MRETTQRIGGTQHMLARLTAGIPLSVPNVVALLSISGNDFHLCQLPADCKDRWGGTHRVLQRRHRDTLAALAVAGTQRGITPEEWLRTLTAQIPERTKALQPLIAEIEAIRTPSAKRAA